MTAENYFIKDQNSVYYLTFTIIDWVDVFTRKEYKMVIADSLNYCIGNKGLEAIQLDNTTLIEQKMNYTHDNPVRAMIVGSQTLMTIFYYRKIFQK